MNQEEKQAARHILGYRGHPDGISGGSFTESLIRTWECADMGNRTRLGWAFPEYIYPMGVIWDHGDDALADLLRM